MNAKQFFDFSLVVLTLCVFWPGFADEALWRESSLRCR